MDKPLVSIIIPIYNGEEYIDNIFECFSKWERKDIEVFLIDDGSSDNSFKLIREKALKDSRFNALKKDNGGIADSRNYGIKHARGRYFYFCDQDDYVDTNVLDEIILCLENGKYDFCMANYATIQNGNKKEHIIIDKRTEIGKRDALNLGKWLVGNGTIEYGSVPRIGSTVWCCLFQKKFLENNNILFEKFIDYEDDWVFLIKCLICAESILLENKILYYWNVNDSSESHKNKYVDRFYENRIELKKFIDDVLDKMQVPIKDRKRFEVMFQRRTLLWNLYNECYRKGSLKDKIRNIQMYTEIELEKTRYNLINKSYSTKENILLMFLMRRCYYLSYLMNKICFKFHFH